MKFLECAECIWDSGEESSSDQYRVFRKEFELPEYGEKRILLHIAADSTYEARVNGIRVPGQQLADMPEDRTVAVLDITEMAHPGKNEIRVEVHYIGIWFLTYRPGRAFLRAAISDGERVFAATGPDWECGVVPEMKSGLNVKLTEQLGFVFLCDKRKSAGAELHPAVVLKGTENWRFSPRSVPQLAELSRPETTVVQCGYLRRARAEGSFAEQAYHDYLSPRAAGEFFSELPGSVRRDGMFRSRLRRKGEEDALLQFAPLPEGEGAEGYYLIIDTGREHVGYLSLEVFAPEGTEVDICHGEHLDDGRVRSRIGTRNFADRLVCREGRNELLYTHRRIGGRYLELHFTRTGGGELAVGYVGIVPLELPLPPEAEFVSPDRMLARINRLSADTLKLCMHEHYEDCPWREQSLYAYDSRNQILYGNYLWSNYRFVAASLDLLGKSFDGERYLELTSPGGTSLTIPVFTLVWICELYEYRLYSGDAALTEKWLAQVDAILDRALSEEVPGFAGLYHPGNGEKIWNFCEWNGELSTLSRHPQSPYNIYLCEALRSAAELHRDAGSVSRAAYLREKADALGVMIEKVFFDPSRNIYAVVAGETDEGYEHIQSIMLANDLVPEEKKPAILEQLYFKKLRGIDLSALGYLMKALMRSGEAARRFLFAYLREILEKVAVSGATSLWETRQGGDDFDFAGSLCHGWSAAMPFFCGRYILGVRPLTPGFRTFEVKPYSAGLPWAHGGVPTPSGEIRVSWEKTPSGLKVHVRHPRELVCVGAQWEEDPVSEWDIAVAEK